MTYIYAACTVFVTIFSTGDKFWLVYFTELHILLHHPFLGDLT